jgi:hypothetical protein
MKQLIMLIRKEAEVSVAVVVGVWFVKDGATAPPNTTRLALWSIQAARHTSGGNVDVA